MTAASFSFSKLIFHPRRVPREEKPTPPFQAYRPVEREAITSYVKGNKRQHHHKGGAYYFSRRYW